MKKFLQIVRNIVIALIVIAIIFITPLSIALKIQDRAHYLGEKNECVLHNGDELPFSKRIPNYECRDIQLQERLNSLLFLVESVLGFYAVLVITSPVTVPAIAILILFIYCIYRLLKWFFKQLTR